MERWESSYLPRPDQLIAGLPNDETMAIRTPALVFRSGASDPFHPRETSEAVAAMLPYARLVDPPWGGSGMARKASRAAEERRRLRQVAPPDPATGRLGRRSAGFTLAELG
jgi:hypothetical protein